MNNQEQQKITFKLFVSQFVEHNTDFIGICVAVLISVPVVLWFLWDI